MKEPVGAIILAAGASTRLGEPKQLVRFEGQSLLRRATDAALASKCQTVVVVLGADASRTEKELHSLPVIVVHNERWSEGMSTSVRIGLEALEANHGTNDDNRVLDAAVLMPCDQPHLSPEVLNRLMEAHHETGQPIVVSGYSNTWGVPMLFARSLWPELHELNGSRGAKSVAVRHAEQVECVPFPGGAFDVDTRDDLERLHINKSGPHGSGAPKPPSNSPYST